MTEFQVKYSAAELKMAAITMARESCRAITEARTLRNVRQSEEIIQAAVKKMDAATLLRGKVSRLLEKQGADTR